LNINTRADGRFSTSVQHNGLRRFIYGKTEKEVRDKAREIEKTILMTNTIPNPCKRTVADLLDAWLASADSGSDSASLEQAYPFAAATRTLAAVVRRPWED
jgi:hypothetical protein